jgi:hypothetical protein
MAQLQIVGSGRGREREVVKIWTNGNIQLKGVGRFEPPGMRDLNRLFQVVVGGPLLYH